MSDLTCDACICHAVNNSFTFSKHADLVSYSTLGGILCPPLRWLFNKLLSKSAKLTRPQFSTSTSIRFIPDFAWSTITWSCIVQSTVSTSSPFSNTYQHSQHNLHYLHWLCGYRRGVLLLLLRVLAWSVAVVVAVSTGVERCCCCCEY